MVAKQCSLQYFVYFGTSGQDGKRIIQLYVIFFMQVGIIQITLVNFMSM
jgi:hypothetical protein